MNFFMCGFVYCLFSLNISAKSGLSQDITSTSPSSRRRVVVFDVDNTLCKCDIMEQELENAKKYYPECPIFFWPTSCAWFGNVNVSHVFLPHLQILFDYLIERNVRIVFFSSANEERNFLVIPQLLSSFWGTQQFEALKAKGQFDIFSKKHLRWGNYSMQTGEGNEVKDLRKVIREGETLSDVILVEDDPGYVIHGQKPFLQSMNLGCNYLDKVDKRVTTEEERTIPFLQITDWARKSPGFALNSVYFMIGIFKTYFENERYKILPFRESLNEIMPEKQYSKWNDFFEKHSFAYDMFDLGLSEVQKRVPNATFYGLRHPHVGSYKSDSSF